MRFNKMYILYVYVFRNNPLFLQNGFFKKIPSHGYSLRRGSLLARIIHTCCGADHRTEALTP